MRTPASLVVSLALAAATGAAVAAAGSDAAARYSVRALALPGGTEDGITMDYVAFDPHTGSLWVPAGNTGAVDVVDTGTGTVRQIAGFPTTEVEVRGRKRLVGPSSAAIGDGRIYIGNRGDSTVCAVDAQSLQRGPCGHLDAMPDGLIYVASEKEVWVTTPRDNSVRILDAATLAQKARLGRGLDPSGQN